MFDIVLLVQDAVEELESTWPTLILEANTTQKKGVRHVGKRKHCETTLERMATSHIHLYPLCQAMALVQKP